LPDLSRQIDSDCGIHVAGSIASRKIRQKTKSPPYTGGLFCAKRLRNLSTVKRVLNSEQQGVGG
jgi:hypothetical protein